MADTIAVKITADVVDLQTKFALAKAESSALSSELNKLAREAVAAGGATPELSSRLQQVTARSLDAKAKVADLSKEMRVGKESTIDLSKGFELAEQALAAFGVAAGVAEIVEFGRHVNEVAEHVYHEAEVLELTTTAYQAFSEGGKLAGVSIDTVDIALRKFNASQGAALEGTGNQAKAFNDLNVSAKLPAEQALPAVARALLSIEDAARRSRDEVALFGKTGEELNPALEQWAEGTETLTKKLEELGLEYDPGLVKKAHDAKVAQDIAWDQVDVKWAPAAVKLKGILAEMAGAYSSLLQSAHDAGDSFGVFLTNAFGHLPGGGVSIPINPEAVAPGAQKKKGAEGTAPPPNFTDNEDAKKAAQQARQIADEIARAYEQGNLRHIQSDEQTNAFLLHLGRETISEWKAQADALETARYQAQLEGVHKREAADKNDAVRLAADRAQEAQLYREHTDRLTSIDQQYLDKKRSMEQQELDAFIQNKQEELEDGRRILQEKFKAYQISAQQEHDQEIQLTRTIQAEVLKRLDAEIAGLKKGTDQYNQEMQKRQELERRFSRGVQAADTALTQEQNRRWVTLGHSMASSISSSLNQMILYGGSFGDFMISVAGSITEAFLKAGEEWLEEQILQAIIGNTTGAAAAVTKVGQNAAVAGAAAYASTAAIPIIGPELAPAAAAVAYGDTLSFAALVPLAVGTNFVPQDMPALIHKGERVIPAADNRDLINAVSGGGGGDIHLHGPFVQAIDTRSGMQFLLQNMHHIAKAVGNYQSKNPSTRPKY